MHLKTFVHPRTPFFKGVPRGEYPSGDVYTKDIGKMPNLKL